MQFSFRTSSTDCRRTFLSVDTVRYFTVFWYIVSTVKQRHFQHSRVKSRQLRRLTKANRWIEIIKARNRRPEKLCKLKPSIFDGFYWSNIKLFQESVNNFPCCFKGNKSIQKLLLGDSRLTRTLSCARFDRARKNELLLSTGKATPSRAWAALITDICCITIYLVDSVIQPWNNQG